MNKIDNIELTLSQLGYNRTNDTVGYHITLSKSIASFRHYLAPKDDFQKMLLIMGENVVAQPDGVLTTHRVYNHDAFLTHTVQYGEKDILVEMPYNIKNGLTSFLEEEITLYLKSFEEPEVKKSLLMRFLIGKSLERLNLTRGLSDHDLFSSEENYIKILDIYLARSLSLVNNDREAVKRFSILMEKADFKNPEALAVIALDTNDKSLKTFLNFVQANQELHIEITDYKAAYNAFSLVDQYEFED
jgi:hypothetical protein